MTKFLLLTLFFAFSGPTLAPGAERSARAAKPGKAREVPSVLPFGLKWSQKPSEVRDAMDAAGAKRQFSVGGSESFNAVTLWGLSVQECGVSFAAGQVSSVSLTFAAEGENEKGLTAALKEKHGQPTAVAENAATTVLRWKLRAAEGFPIEIMLEHKDQNPVVSISFERQK